MRKWKYDTLLYYEPKPVIEDNKGLLEFLNKWGDWGWEVVTMLPPRANAGRFLFEFLIKKQEIPEPSVSPASPMTTQEILDDPRR